MYTLGKTNLVEMQIRSRRSSFLLGRILFDELFDEPASTSSENASFWVGRIFCDEPASTSSENAPNG